MSKFNFNIDIENNELGNSLSKSLHDSKLQKELYDEYSNIIDLGLPSGTRWCKYNLGCDYDLLNNHLEQSNTEDWYGGYYMWGDTESVSVDFEAKECDQCCDWDHYTHAVSKCNNCLIKYCNKSSSGYEGFIDNLTLLLLEDDAAYQNMHYKNYKFCIPTKELFEELLEYTTSNSITNYEVNGKKIIGLNGLELTSKNNKQKLFFPFTGYCDDYNLCDVGNYANYWSSNLDLENPDYACDFYCGYNKIDKNIDHRCYGFSIRPVLMK